jgi:ABC-type lipoprotein export system ATPase subunit
MLLNADNIWKKYDGPDILTGTGISAGDGDTIAITGPSGCGKSTFLNILGGLEVPDMGSVIINNINLSKLDTDKSAAFRREHIGFIFQDHFLLPQLTAKENILLPQINRPVTADIDNILNQVGIIERCDAMPAQMSGGERQRTAIARAIVNKPGLLLCDEPTGNLDEENGAKVMKLLLDLAKDLQIIIIMVTHNIDFANMFSKRYLLKHGKLIQQ